MPPAVQLDLTAGKQLIAQHGPTPLHPGLGAAGGQPKTEPHLPLGKAFEFGESQRFPVPVRELLDELTEEGRQHLFGGRAFIVIARRHRRIGQRDGTNSAVVVDDGVVGDPIQPRGQSGVIVQRFDATLDLDEDLLKDVFRVVG